MKIHSVFTLIALACVASAQQQQLQNVAPTQQLQAPAAPAAAANCSMLTTKPTPEAKKYVFQHCIVAQFAAYLTVAPGQYVSLQNGTVNQNASNCENVTTSVEPKLVVDFECGSLSLSISHTNDSKTFVKSINGQYSVTTNGTASAVTFTNTTPLFSTTQTGHYYKCNAEQTIPVTSAQANTTLVISNFALEAYRDATGTDFYQIPEDCPLDSQPVSDLVRIGVGVCLVALVAIVLIAYFIGRRRWSERSSYESV